MTKTYHTPQKNCIVCGNIARFDENMKLQFPTEKVPGPIIKMQLAIRLWKARNN